MNNLAKRIDEILTHCFNNGVVTGKYWRGYAQNTFIEVDLFGDDIFSHRFIFSTTFGGGSARPKLPTEKSSFVDHLDSFFWKVFSPRMPSIFRKNVLSDLLFRWLSGRILGRQAYALGNSYFDTFVNSYYYLLKDDIERYRLETTAQSSSNDVDILSTNGKTFPFSYVTLRNFSNFLRIFHSTT